MITLRLGDPLYGRPLATFPVPRTGRYDLRAMAARLAAEPGVHDLYVVFENEGVTLTQLDLGPGA
jgi:beta-glucosidase